MTARAMLLTVLDEVHADVVILACADFGVRLEHGDAERLARIFDLAPDPNAEAEALIARRFAGVRGLVRWRRRPIPEALRKFMQSNALRQGGRDGA